MTELHNAALRHAQALIRCPSVTPEEGGALTYLQSTLEEVGFSCQRIVFSDENTPDIDNLYARIGTEAPNLCFAGHTDVVPIGDEAAWSQKPFAGDVVAGRLYGRGTVDMKGGIACFMAAALDYLQANSEFSGSISFLITGDEEGPAINGTRKVLEWLDKKGEKLDACIVGEPTNANEVGDTIKVGRRGSLTGMLTVNGTQGHVAYPHLADNPIPKIVDLVQAALATPLDEGTEHFQPTNLEFTTVDVGNPATNVIPGTARATFNIRFNDLWSAETLKAELKKRFDTCEHAYEIEYMPALSDVFLTRNDALISPLADAIEAVTSQIPAQTTGGGTSDARFIKNYCPVVEFGLVGQTMHQIDENSTIEAVNNLTDIYRTFLDRYFKG